MVLGSRPTSFYFDWRFLCFPGFALLFATLPFTQAAESTPSNSIHDLYLAITANNVARVHELLETGVDPNAVLQPSGTRLFEMALLTGTDDIVLDFIAHGANVRTRSESSGFSPLFTVIQSQSTTLVAAMLDHGADPNQFIGPEGKLSLPLTFAIFRRPQPPADPLAIVRLLLEHGADPNRMLNTGSTADATPFYGAFNFADNDPAQTDQLVALLLAHGGDPQQPGSQGFCPLDEAIRCRDLRILRRLLRHGVEFHRPNGQGATPLRMASLQQNGALELVYAQAQVIPTTLLSAIWLLAVAGMLVVATRRFRHWRAKLAAEPGLAPRQVGQVNRAGPETLRQLMLYTRRRFYSIRPFLGVVLGSQLLVLILHPFEPFLYEQLPVSLWFFGFAVFGILSVLALCHGQIERFAWLAGILNGPLVMIISLSGRLLPRAPWHVIWPTMVLLVGNILLSVGLIFLVAVYTGNYWRAHRAWRKTQPTASPEDDAHPLPPNPAWDETRRSD